MDVDDLKWLVGIAATAAAALWAVTRSIHGRIRDVDERAGKAIEAAEARSKAEMEAVEKRGRAGVHENVTRLDQAIKDTRDNLTARMDRIEGTLADMRRENKEDHAGLRDFIAATIAGKA